MSFEEKAAIFKRLAETFECLSNPDRLRILKLLSEKKLEQKSKRIPATDYPVVADGERCVYVMSGRPYDFRVRQCRLPKYGK